jgi:ribose transport system ATP-binding protein
VIDQTELRPTTVAPTLMMSGIVKTYSGVAALTDVSIEVKPGEVHAILGENGAGKSTLMNIASGSTQPDSGTISFNGEAVDALSPNEAVRLGIAVVHQHPAVMTDLTILENLLVALPDSVFEGETSVAEIATAMLRGVGLEAHLHDRVEGLTVAQKHLLEIAKAFALKPKLLILDEPTAPLGQAAVELLFSRIRSAVERGTSVIYITHRMAEVRELANRVTVLRDGQVRGTAAVEDINDSELLALIVGRKLEATFPPKRVIVGDDSEGVINFRATRIAGPGFVDVSLVGQRGEIIGIAGVVGNGQSELLRALAGLEPFTGTVAIADKTYTHRELLHRAAFMPADRHREGLMMSLTVRENAAVSALHKFKSFALVSKRKELEGVRESLSALTVKAPSMDAPVSALSGGNQQKVVISRALLSEPAILIADEPTQGVDVGARVEIYRILREASDSGVPVVVASSDAKELEGLCDRVIVLSRGHVVSTLVGDQITEEAIVTAAVSSTTQSIEVGSGAATTVRSTGLRRFVQGDYAPSALLVLVILILGAFIAAQNARYLGDFNVSTILITACALGAIAIGQTIPLILGGIDLSVGPLAGFLVVISSFFINDGKPVGMIVLGLVLMIVAAVVVGVVNGILIRYLRFTPIAATLTLYIALGGFAFLMRNTQGGYISTTFTSAVSTSIGPIPVAFIVLVLIALAMEYFLRKRRWGWNLRAAGSNEESARSVGIRINRTVILGYAASSAFVFLGAIILMTQIGIGDPAEGSTYTLTSITAVVLGGTSLLGGRGTFLGSLLGAVLLTQVLNATTVLGLGSLYQYVFQGVLILAAAIIYSLARARKKRAQFV